MTHFDDMYQVYIERRRIYDLSYAVLSRIPIGLLAFLITLSVPSVDTKKLNMALGTISIIASILVGPVSSGTLAGAALIVFAIQQTFYENIIILIIVGPEVVDKFTKAINNAVSESAWVPSWLKQKIINLLVNATPNLESIYEVKEANFPEPRADRVIFEAKPRGFMDYLKSADPGSEDLLDTEMYASWEDNFASLLGDPDVHTHESIPQKISTPKVK